MQIASFEIRPQERAVTCFVAEPAAQHIASDPAVVLTFALAAHSAFHEPIYDIPMRVFLDAGHRALTFDPPNHGTRVGVPKRQGIAGMCDAFLSGEDPFAMFVADGIAAIDALLERGLARPGRIFVAGLSRCGYLALRLAAADPRVNGVAAVCPVTDWRALREFDPVKDRQDVGDLAIENYAHALAGRPICIAIGNHDDRVSTACSVRFMSRLHEIEEQRGMTRSDAALHVVRESLGHGLHPYWRREAARYLLKLL